MSARYDVIVIGSGFGGAVTACRLAESGARVLVLERGRRWAKEDYPRGASAAWLYSNDHPEHKNGWLDLRFFKGMAVAQGAGVGGGSLCYSSVLLEANDWRFATGWPVEITFAELRPYYEKALTMLGAKPLPEGQLTARYRLLRKAAAKAGYSSRLTSMPLAISFDPEWNYDLDDPLNIKHSKAFINPQGQNQGSCVHLGNCDIGCDVRAKNTLDLNYIPGAERCGAEVRPLHFVRSIAPEGANYRVSYDRIDQNRFVSGSVVGAKVVIAAGSLGSTELLLRCRDELATLPRVSPKLGCDWSANANVLTPDVYDKHRLIRQSIGPTISAGLDFTDGSEGGHRFLIEDDGFPNMLLNAINSHIRSEGFSLLSVALREHLKRGVDESNPLRNMMVWLGAGVDAGDGVLSLRRSWLPPWQSKLSLSWDVRKTKQVIDAILAIQQKLSNAAGGKLIVPLYWTLLRSLVTVHPLGGCKMGNSANDAVVDHRGAVFGYENLYVIDGAIIPTPLGRNPSLTIAALAERSSHLMSGTS